MNVGSVSVQAKFNAVYNTTTRSNNNDWLRRKLLEGASHHVHPTCSDAIQLGAREAVTVGGGGGALRCTTFEPIIILELSRLDTDSHCEIQRQTRWLS